MVACKTKQNFYQALSQPHIKNEPISLFRSLLHQTRSLASNKAIFWLFSFLFFLVILKARIMIPLEFSKCYYQTPLVWRLSKLQKGLVKPTSFYPNRVISRRKLVVSGCSGQESEKKTTERRSFLSLEEAGLVEISGLSTHERFLCRLTVSSLNLLRVISEQEGCPIEALNAGRICDWFLKDKLKREQNTESAVLQWDDSEFPF